MGRQFRLTALAALAAFLGLAGATAAQFRPFRPPARPPRTPRPRFPAPHFPPPFHRPTMPGHGVPQPGFPRPAPSWPPRQPQPPPKSVTVPQQVRHLLNRNLPQEALLLLRRVKSALPPQTVADLAHQAVHALALRAQDTKTPVLTLGEARLSRGPGLARLGPDTESILEALEAGLARWMAAIDGVPAKDVPSFKKVQAAYMPHLKTAPLNRAGPPLGEAEQRWVERSTRAWAEDLAKLGAQEYKAFEALRKSYQAYNWGLAAAEVDWLVRACGALRPGDFQSLARVRTCAGASRASAPAFQAAQTAWAERTARALLAKVSPLLKTEPATASARLRRGDIDLADFEAARQLLQPARRQALQARLDLTYRQVLEQVTEDPTRDRTQEVDRIANRLEADARAEAVALGMQQALDHFHKNCAFLGKLSRSAARGAGPAK